ncbi:S-phase kinase-associated protein 1 [Phytophthora cactorum]|nr:S-phase kinase-associated protein 1 [Phytophthora cactorum]
MEEFTEEEQLAQTLVADEHEGDKMQEISLPNVKALVLAKVADSCQHHKDASMDEIQKPLKCSVLSESGDEWATKFVDVARQELLFELVLAANYMDIMSLLAVLCAKMACMIKGRRVGHIRQRSHGA